MSEPTARPMARTAAHPESPESSSRPSTNDEPPAPPAGTHPEHPSFRPPVAHLAATTPDERNWAVGAHLSGFLAAYVALGFLGPLVVMLTGGTRSPYVRRHAVEALNFNLSVLLWLAISGILVVLIIGFPMLLGVGILYIVASVRGALAASRGEEFRYPLTIRFVS